ncbi:MAG: ABC transporter ATP-binding protein [Ruminococcaceae bacterium]|nr:ABC transporter ATP-binding protein [Oscillospiraceae bacterium]
MIEISHLTKRYGNHTAVSDLNFTIESGKIYGFLGPNGAGKSTTMNIMTGCLSATEGQVTIDGYDIFADAEKAKKLIGYLPEQPPLYPDMTPREYLIFVAKAKGVAKPDIDKQLEYVTGVTGIEDVQNRLIKQLSKGYRQRVGLAQALLGEPQVIILDEPTVGLDPLQIIEIRDLITKLGKDHTVILSSHILSEVRAVCDAILIISHGKLVASDTPENLEKLFAGTATLQLTVKASLKEVEAALEKVDGITSLASVPAPDMPGAQQVTIESSGGDDLSEKVFFAFSDIRKPIVRMALSRASLEEIFLELTTKDTDDAPPDDTPVMAEVGGMVMADLSFGDETIEEVPHESDI